MELFVSGRLCLFGEHSDWAGEYRQVNPDLEPGYAIVVGTNQGVYGRVATNSYLSFKTLHSCEKLNLAMSEDLLLAVAQSNHFYSYVAGTAYQALIHYRVGGIAIDNYRMDLPLQKGLSSSAAVCVLIAKAFNRLYDLGLSITEEMELAYWGERTTPSQCGRLDQACAYGKQPILMEFDGDRPTIKPLTVGQSLHLIDYIYGGKGVGSQGDGTAQLIARDRQSQIRAIALIEQNFPSMQCYKLDIPRTENRNLKGIK